EFPDADGATRQGSVTLSRFSTFVRMEFTVGDSFEQYIGWDPSDRLTFAAKPQDAPVVHLGGPLSFRWYNTPPNLIAGQRCRFYRGRGPRGGGKGSFAAVQVCSVPAGTGVVALIDYPNRDISQPPIQQKLDLGID